MQEVVTYCDFCGREDTPSCSKNTIKICAYDICGGCQSKILRTIIEERELNLRPWCKECGGTGKVEESDYGLDHIIRSMVECKSCKL